ALSVAENVEFPLHFFKKLTARQRLDKVMTALEDVGMLKFAGHNPRQLSGGQRQRTAIARALVGSPAIILADEPTANLDAKNGHDVMLLLCQIACQEQRGVVIVSHDSRLRSVAKRVLTIEDGRLVREEPGQHNLVCTMRHHAYQLDVQRT
ncbi:MAG: ATP-binding cassette domain-containing protein, partial [Candidatus Kerfeldbacteria bacterium]|nr:ATP-binding cassette domain-containing protein [Candidatus Kerfeldbacteria bacterium]